MSGPRDFRPIFSDNSESKDQLARVRTDCWYDGNALLFEGWAMHRHDRVHEWSYPDGATTLKVFDGLTRSQAVRRAVQLHDEFAREHFARHAALQAEPASAQ